MMRWLSTVFAVWAIAAVSAYTFYDDGRITVQNKTGCDVFAATGGGLVRIGPYSEARVFSPASVLPRLRECNPSAGKRNRGVDV